MNSGLELMLATIRKCMERNATIGVRKGWNDCQHPMYETDATKCGVSRTFDYGAFGALFWLCAMRCVQPTNQPVVQRSQTYVTNVCSIDFVSFKQIRNHGGSLWCYFIRLAQQTIFCIWNRADGCDAYPYIHKYASTHRCTCHISSSSTSTRLIRLRIGFLILTFAAVRTAEIVVVKHNHTIPTSWSTWNGNANQSDIATESS